MLPYLRLAFYTFFWTEWQYVGLFVRKAEYEGSDYRVYLHCYESRWGKRKIKIGAYRHKYASNISGGPIIKNRIRTGDFYQTQMVPWLEGRNHDEIPGFEIVKSGKWDFTKKLKGETPVVLNDDE